MKNILYVFILVLSTSVTFANDAKTEKSVFPRVTVWPNGVDLRINNFTDDDFSCSGPIYIRHQSGKTSTEYYFGRVYSRANEYRYFPNRDFRDNLVSAYHSIFCNRL